MVLNDALSLPEGPVRTAAIVAWIQSLFSRGARVPILVGGAAVEIFTGGAYTTGDLDFVGSVPKTVGTILENNGFEKVVRHWIHHERLKARAAEEGFEDSLRALLAFDKDWSSSDPDVAIFEMWANRGPEGADR